MRTLLKKAVPIPTEVVFSGILKGEAAPMRCQTPLKSCSKALSLVCQSQPGKTVESFLIYWCAGRQGRGPADGKQTVLQQGAEPQAEPKKEKRSITGSTDY